MATEKNAVVYWYKTAPSPWNSKLCAVALTDIQSADGREPHEGAEYLVKYGTSYHSALILEVLKNSVLKDLVWKLHEAHRNGQHEREDRGETLAQALGLGGEEPETVTPESSVYTEATVKLEPDIAIYFEQIQDVPQNLEPPQNDQQPDLFVAPAPILPAPTPVTASSTHPLPAVWRSVEKRRIKTVMLQQSSSDPLHAPGPVAKSAPRKRKLPQATSSPVKSEEVPWGRRPTRTCQSKYQKTSKAKKAAPCQPTRAVLPWSPFLHYPWLTPRNGFPLALAQAVNPRISINGWFRRGVKDNLRLYVSRQKSGQSAFSFDQKHTFKNKFWALEEGYIASNNCRTMHRLSCYPANGKHSRMKQLYGPAKGDILPKEVHSVIFMTRNLGIGSGKDESDLVSDWIKAPINQNDIILTTEQDVRRNFFLRVASVPTGEEFLRIWLSSGEPKFKEMDFYRGNDRICMTSSRYKPRDGTYGFTMLFWRLFPFRYAGGFRVDESVFGKNVQDVGESGSILLISRESRSCGVHYVDLYDMTVAMSEIRLSDVVVGGEWNRERYVLSCSGFDPRNSNLPLKYGRNPCGMPLSYTFPDQPQLLYRVETCHGVALTAMHHRLLTIADAKSKQFKIMDIFSKQQIPGPILQTVNLAMQPDIVPENILLVQSKPERIAIWTGSQLKLYGLHSTRSGENHQAGQPTWEIREDFSYALPSDLPELEHSAPEWDLEPIMHYDYIMDILFVLFRDGELGWRVVLLIDGTNGSVLSTTVLKAKICHSCNVVEAVSLDEFGLIYTQNGGGQQVMTIYSMHAPP